MQTAGVSVSASDAVGTDPAEPAALRLAGLTQWFGNTQALSDLNLEVRPGTIHAFVGENGAGKSTCLGVLAGATETEGFHRLATESGLEYDQFESMIPNEVVPASLVQWVAQPEEVASTAAFIASPLASLTNGAAVRCEGGAVGRSARQQTSGIPVSNSIPHSLRGMKYSFEKCPGLDSVNW